MYLVLINLVTPKARAKHELFVQQTGLSIGHYVFIIIKLQKHLVLVKQDKMYKLVPLNVTQLVSISGALYDKLKFKNELFH